MKKITNLLFVALIATILMSCGSSVESQLKGWDSNLKSVDTYKAKYPSLKMFLQEDVDAGTTVKTEADALTDEKAKIKKMKEANGKISGGILKNIKDLESKISSTKTKETSLKNAKVADDQKTYATQATTDTKTALTNADKVFTATYSNKNESIEAIKKQITKLDDACTEIDRIISKTDEVNKKVEEDNKKVEENKVKEEEAAKPIKCEYCESMNEATATKCKNCGAPIEKK